MSTTNTISLDDLTILERFRVAVWGDEHIFEKSARQQGSRVIDYLDFGNHLYAVNVFCDAVRSPRLLILKEYREAMKNLGVEGSIYRDGACILGQPGIGKLCHIQSVFSDSFLS